MTAPRPIFRLSWLYRAALLLLTCLAASLAEARGADVVIVGDMQYRQVADVAAEVRTVLRSQVREYATGEIKGRLESVVVREDARVVVALGMEALNEAMHLPVSVPVVYGLVIAPPRGRANMTGVYMATPVGEYAALVRKYLPPLSRFSVIGSPGLVSVLAGPEGNSLVVHRVSTPPEVMSAVNRVDTHALLLLPDASLLSTSVMENVFLFSFRKNIPVLGISEGNVKQGSLFALVFEPKGVGRQIGEKVHKVLQHTPADDIPASPPRRFNLFINTNTAKKMDIPLPDEMLKKAKRTYP